MLNLPAIGKYLARNGNEIILDPKTTATKDEIRLFLLGSVMGTILHQRGFLPLHGSAVQIHHGACIIIGNSATGKSTLAASLSKKGFPLISDDLSAISLDQEGTCQIHPGIPFIKLWKDVSGIMYPGKELNKVRPQIEKYKLPVDPGISLTEQSPVRKIILLTTKNEAGFEVLEVSGAHKLKLMREHIFRDQVMKGLGLMENHFKLLSQLVNQAGLYHISRPSRPLQIEELSDLVIEKILN